MASALSFAFAVYIASASAGGVGERVDGGLGDGVAGGIREVAVGVEGVVASGVFVWGIVQSWPPLLCGLVDCTPGTKCHCASR